MDEAAIQRVVNFSVHLRNSADLILNHSALVSLDTWTLYEIEEAFSLIFEVEKYTNFHVLPPSNREHPAIPYIQFLYDILQKVRKLRILTQSYHVLPQEQQINLKCFRSLSYLELDSIPINQLKGLQNVRPVLKHLIVKNACTQVNDILLKCGADMATEYLWESLEIANFSRNNISHLDSSLRLLSAIKILDLSYCQLVDAISLFCLPTISHLNLSYNKLTTMPALSEKASNMLQFLNLSNNMMIDLRGIERFANLEHLDLKENFISVEQTLVHLSDLIHLKYLNLLRNPITCGVNYRAQVLRCLNTAIRSCEQFILDDSPLIFGERKLVGSPLEPLQLGGPSTQLLKYLLDSVSRVLRLGSSTSESSSVMHNASVTQECPPITSVLSDVQTEHGSPSLTSIGTTTTMRSLTRKKGRKNRIRHVAMTDQDDSIDSSSLLFGSYPRSIADISLNEDKNSPEPSEASENRLTFNYPKSHLVDDHEISTLTSAPSQSDKLLEEILNSHLHNLSKSFTSPDVTLSEPETRPDPETSKLDISNLASSIISSSTSSIYKLNDSYSMDLSPLTTDDEELEPQRELYSVIAKWENKVNDKNTEVDSDFVFLSFTQYFYKEKDGLSRGTMVKLPISSLQNMEVLSSSPVKVQLNFNHHSSDLCSRRFIFEDEDFKLLKDLVDPIIEQNLKQESALPLPCRKCGLPFYGIKAKVSGAKRSKKYCKYCGNKKLKPHPMYSTTETGYLGEDINSILQNVNSNDSSMIHKESDKNNTTDRRHKRERSVISSDSSESVSVCSSGGVSASACNLKRTTDMDLVSNPSMSSIEVLHENLTTDGEDMRNDNDHSLLAASNGDSRTQLDMEPSVLKGGVSGYVTTFKEQTVMQESSSSGSMSGSVCTTVDRLSTGPSTPRKQLGGVTKEGEESSEVETHIDNANSMTLNKNSEESHYLSTSVKSTDTVCHRPQSLTLREAFDFFSEEDYDRKGIILEDPSGSVPLTHWTQNLLTCYTGYSWEWWKEMNDDFNGNSCSRSSNMLSFSFDDFSVVDHRLKLYCELFLFTEHQEILQGLVRVIASVNNGTPFLSILAISNRKVYILRITSQENDSPQDWLEVEAYCFLEEVPSVFTVFHKQGMVIKLKDKLVLLCLSDSQRANAVLYFILDCLERFGYHPCMDDTSCRSQSEDLRRQIEQLHFEDLDPIVHLFQMVTLLHHNGECTNHFLVVTTSHVILFEADLSWLSLPSLNTSISENKSETATDLIVTSCYCLDDVTQIELYSDNHFKLEFYQQDGSEAKPPWAIHVASPWVGCNFIQTIRPLWEDIMKIDLDVVCYNEDLFYIREALRDTEFAPYIQ